MEKSAHYTWQITVLFSNIFYLFTSFLSSPEDMLIDLREGGREGKRETLMREGNTYWLPAVHASIEYKPAA